MITSRRNQIFLFVLFLLLLIMAYVYLIAPIRSDVSDVRVETKRKKAELAALQIRLNGGASIADKDKAALDKTRSLIPDSYQPELLLRDLRMLEVTSGMKMEAYNLPNVGVNEAKADPSKSGSGVNHAAEADKAVPSTEASLALATPIHTTAKLKGTYSQIFRLFQEAEAMRRIMQVDKIAFDTSTGAHIEWNRPDKQIECSITFLSYYSPGLAKYFSNPIPVDADPPAKRTNPIQ